ncbi:putative F-box/LRR-repeat protein At4g15060 [Papaver somniferum]|uniref:putative F-box/LRR-repeat protein At4g15060 n=1 Tax=Papaver somniferum TaxID=3469 RepID=UPI000E6F9B7E|nr:putative F-box/LRR-repeat protein At4g15060 [Papaver somniferum]
MAAKNRKRLINSQPRNIINNNNNMEDVGEDRISKLPESLIQHVLSFLPTKCAVSTTVLSKTWKNLWKFCLNLDIRHFDGNLVREWITALIKRKVEELVLNVPFPKPNMVSQNLITCESLTMLDLNFQCQHVLDIPQSICLPKLKYPSSMVAGYRVTFIVGNIPSLVEVDFRNARDNGTSTLESLSEFIKMCSGIKLLKASREYFQVHFLKEVNELVLNPSPHCLLSRLGSIELRIYERYPEDMEVVKLLLKYARVLEMVIISGRRFLNPSSEMFQQLQNFPRASTHCSFQLLE